jgi:hypothetical protein
VPKDTIFRIRLSEHKSATATARWSQEDRVGIEFSSALELDERGAIATVGLRNTGEDWEANTRKVG